MHEAQLGENKWWHEQGDIWFWYWFLFTCNNIRSDNQKSQGPPVIQVAKILRQFHIINKNRAHDHKEWMQCKHDKVFNEFADRPLCVQLVLHWHEHELDHAEIPPSVIHQQATSYNYCTNNAPPKNNPPWTTQNMTCWSAHNSTKGSVSWHSR